MSAFDSPAPRILRAVEFFQRAGNGRTLGLAILLVAVTAVADWFVGTEISMGLLYIVPLMVAATVFPPSTIVAMSVICAGLGVIFYHPRPPLQTALHFFFALAANLCAGLFIGALIRNRRLALDHVDQMSREHTLRQAAEEHLRVLAESSLATILTLDDCGNVLAANRAANALFGIPPGESVVGRSAGDYLPVLMDALGFAWRKEAIQTAMQSRGKRHNGEMFLADTWISTYHAPEGLRLAAIVVDSSQEMRDREERHLQQVSMANRVTAAAMSHEVRNFCGAMSLLHSHLTRDGGLQPDRRFQELGNLIDGLGSIASMELESDIQEFLEEVPLQQVLEDLRIVIEPAWREVAGTVCWDLPEKLPVVLGQRHGLLQALLNLAQNSRRAVTGCPRRELTIRVEEVAGRAIIRCHDSGPGIAEPDRLFKPFQSGAESAGIGLYVSRAILRNYGGELRYDPQPHGACFAVELEAISE